MPAERRTLTLFRPERGPARELDCGCAVLGKYHDAFEKENYHVQAIGLIEFVGFGSFITHRLDSVCSGSCNGVA